MKEHRKDKMLKVDNKNLIESLYEGQVLLESKLQELSNDVNEIKEKIIPSSSVEKQNRDVEMKVIKGNFFKDRE